MKSSPNSLETPSGYEARQDESVGAKCEMIAAASDDGGGGFSELTIKAYNERDGWPPSEVMCDN